MREDRVPHASGVACSPDPERCRGPHVAREEGAHEDDFMRCPTCGVSKRKLEAAEKLLAALKGLLADIQDYQRVNRLGGEDNHWQVLSRQAIEAYERSL